MTAHTWRGRRGAVKLGPTEHRVARYLVDATAHGLVLVRMAELAERLGLSRTEAYRITGRLRVLGLFGIANDPGGVAGGRRVWRTAIRHDGADLDQVRHRLAWARLTAWARARRADVLDHTRGARPRAPETSRPAADPAAAGRTFDQLVAPHLGAWFHERSARYG